MEHEYSNLSCFVTIGSNVPSQPLDHLWRHQGLRFDMGDTYNYGAPKM